MWYWLLAMTKTTTNARRRTRPTFAALAIAFTIGLAGQACALAAPSKPAGWSDRSYYLPMRDGTRIALSLYFPHGKPPKTPTPTVLVQTRYGRARAFARDVLAEQKLFRDAGYVVAIADTRGSTSSFGPRDIDIGPDQVRDIDEIVAHLVAQPWSSKQVIAHGVSYAADTADVSTSRPAPGLTAAIIRQSELDALLHLFAPGGVVNDLFLSGWGARTYEMDLGRGRAGGIELDCRERASDCAKLFPTLQPVDGDEHYTLLRQALNGKRRWSVSDYAQADFRDERAGNGYTWMDSSAATRLTDIRTQQKPVQHWGSWMDAGTAEAALARYRSAPEVQAEVWITANNHGNDVFADPFRPQQNQPLPNYGQQFDVMHGFIRRVTSGGPIRRNIHYYVLGSGVFKDTAVWPPHDAKPMQLSFASGRRLVEEPPASPGSERYQVDFTATTGKQTRWSTQLGTPPAYVDRREQDRKLLVYDSEPMRDDIELVGTPVVMLHVASHSKDPAFFVYLEDVGLDGRVTMITEGQFRAIHRKPADPAELPFDPGPAPHSFRVADALAVVPGEVMRVEFVLLPTAVLIRKGHGLRVAIAGADAGTFRRYSEGTEDVFTVHFGGQYASGLHVTVRPWR